MTWQIVLAVGLAAAGAQPAGVGPVAAVPGIRMELREPTLIQIEHRQYGGAAGAVRVLGHEYAVGLKVRLENKGEVALQTIKALFTYLGEGDQVLKRGFRTLTIDPPLQPGRSCDLAFEDYFGEVAPKLTEVVGVVTEINTQRRTLIIARPGKLYGGPSADSVVEQDVEAGAEAEELDWSRRWFKVKLQNGMIGWVHSSVLSLAIFVDGERAAFSADPREEPDGIIVPLADLAAALHAEAKWAPEQNAVGVFRGDLRIYLYEGKTRARVGDRIVEMPVPLTVERGKSFIELRWLCRQLGARVIYDPIARSIGIDTRPRPTVPPAGHIG